MKGGEMSKDGLTEKAYRTSTLATGTSPKIYDPDRYLAQDAENQFKTIFFPNGDYDLPGMMISSINMVSGILKKENGYKFLVWQNGDYAESPSVFSYGSLDQAQGDRAHLIQQIEAFHSRGI